MSNEHPGASNASSNSSRISTAASRAGSELSRRGGRRGGAFVNSRSNGVPSKDSNVLGGPHSSGEMMALGTTSQTVGKTRLSKAKLRKDHKAIVDTYSDLFDRQYDEMRSHMLPERQ